MVAVVVPTGVNGTSNSWPLAGDSRFAVLGVGDNVRSCAELTVTSDKGHASRNAALFDAGVSGIVMSLSSTALLQSHSRSSSSCTTNELIDHPISLRGLVEPTLVEDSFHVSDMDWSTNQSP